MSLDFPKRADWLRVRSMPKPVPRLVHVSKEFFYAPDKSGVIQLWWHKGRPFVAGRNQEKRVAQTDAAARNLMLVTRRFRQRHGQVTKH